MKFIRWLVSLLSVLVVIVIFCLVFFFYLIFFVDPNQYKSQIVSTLEQKYGVFLVIHGDLHWQFYPYFGVGIQDVYLTSTADRNPNHKLAELNEAAVNVRLLSLIRRKVDVNYLHLDGFKLHLAADAQGKLNWLGFVEAHRKSAEPASKVESESGAADQAFDINISNITLDHAELIFTDQKQHLRFHLQQIQAVASEFSLTKPFALQMSAGSLVVSDRPDMRVDRINLSSYLFYDADKSRFMVDQLKLNLSLSDASILTKPLDLVFSSQLSYDFKQKLLNATNNKIEAAGFTLDSQLALNLGGEKLSYQGFVKAGPLRPKEIFSWIKSAEQMNFPDDAMQFASLHTEVSGDSQQIKLTNLLAMLDKARLTGDFSYKFSGSPYMKANLKFSDVNLDAYLPPQPGNKRQEPAIFVDPSSKPALKEEETIYSNKPLLPLDVLRTYDANVRVYVDKLTYKKLHATNLELEFLSEKGKLALDKLTMQLFEGLVKLKAKAYISRDDVKLALTHQLIGIDNKALLTSFFEQPILAGKLFASGNYTTQGNSLADWISHLNGTAEAHVTDGALLNINTDKLACQAVALANKQAFSGKWEADTKFNNLQAKFAITHGVIKHTGFSLDTDHTQALGQGSIDLLKQQFAYELALRLTANKNTANCAIKESLSQIQLPVSCEGNFKDTPAKFCRVNVQKLTDQLKGILSKELKKELKQKTQQVKQQVKGEIHKKVEQTKQKTVEELETEQIELRKKIDKEKTEKTQELEQQLKKLL